MANTDIELDDDEIKKMGSEISKYCIDLQEGIDKYIKIMENIVSDSIMKGDTSKELHNFITYAKNLNSVVKDAGADSKDLSTNFLSEVDSADSVSIGGSSASLNVGFNFSTGGF